MACNNFDGVLVDFKNLQDNSRLLKLLINIRKEVDWPKNRDNIAKLREQHCLKKIISSLQTSKKSVIDVSLSILGNCCLDSKVARDAVSQFGILSNLNQLLKRYPKEDSINGRVFRTVSNICQHSDQWSNVIIEKKPQILIHIVKFLRDDAEAEADGKVSEATITMGLRSLREMLNNETLNDLIKTYEALKVVGMLLIKYGTIWEVTKKYENILINIVKLLQEYSRYKFYPSIQEMRYTDKGDSIVYLSKILMIAPKQIVKIVINFLKISHLKSDLPIPEIFDSFIEVMRKNNIIQDFNANCEECLKCLCHLLDHPGNRKNERCGDSIPMLTSVLSDLPLDSYNKIDCCVLIVSTLNKCKYNESLITEQIKCNMVNVIISKLKQIVGTFEPLNFVHKCEKKRKLIRMIKDHKRNKSEDNADVETSATAASDTDEDVDLFYSYISRFDYSPASSSESELTMSWTSGLSPQSSPRSQIYGMFESDSDDYSPVCSEVDTTDFPLPMMDEEAASNPEPVDNVFEEDDRIPSFETDSGVIRHVKTKLLIEIVDLLKTYVKLRPTVAQLGTPELLLWLIKCSTYFEWPHSSAIVDIVDVVFRVLESHDYLLPLMQTDFIPIAFDLGFMQHGSWCSKCRQFQWISNSMLKKLSKVAESGAGKGDIAHKLLRGDTAVKQQVVLVIPYIIKNRAILMKLMLNCGGLEVLIKMLREDHDVHLQERIFKVLYDLASRKLGIPNPKHTRTSYPASVNDEDDNVEENIQQVVTLKLDDGCLLKADKMLLSKNSDFFSSLFNGGFRESSEDVITLPNVMSTSLQWLLHMVSYDVAKSAPRAIDLDLDTLLDVIALCDRFLMQDYCVYLTDCVEQYRLASDTVSTIYNWSLESRTNLLRVECVAYALVANVVEAERCKMFKSLFQLGYNEELVGDIKNLLVRHMTLTEPYDCSSNRRNNCDEFHVY